MKRIISVRVERSPAPELGIDDLGSFGPTPTNAYAIARPDVPSEERFFNTPDAVVADDGAILDGATPDEFRSNRATDLARAEDFVSGEWCWLYVRAVAEVALTSSEIVQTIVSAGGAVESDADTEWIQRMVEEELDSLRAELLAAGFSRPKVDAAIRDAEIAS